ncbi:transmembrane protein 236 [Betta splendens]|uniref:Transmembrane protein 236 n=1 Tax=Betta splendens TaxID=158456 RepID=A0A6P7L2Y4_BETSP|nr:transmembrane protein 236 [Betta splendens]
MTLAFGGRCSGTMPSGKTVKLVLYELLQFAALVVPVFVTTERFARLVGALKGGDATAYWLVVAVCVAYVTSTTLLVWLPLKYLILKKRRFLREVSQWRPAALAYLILCTLPCFAILITSSKIQVDGGHRLDHFTELPVSLVLFSLICVDVVERIRLCNLTGKSDSPDPDFDMPGPVLTRLELVTTVSAQLHPGDSQNGPGPSPPEARNGGAPGRWADLAGSPGLSSRASSTAYLHSSQPQTHCGRLGFLWRSDARAAAFVDSFLFWLDTVEMLRVAGEPAVFYSAWVFPVYILAFVSALRVVLAPHSPLLASAGVALQDLPFLALRVALLGAFGFVTPVLYPLKNVLVSLTFLYFTLVTRLRMCRRNAMF